MIKLNELRNICYKVLLNEKYYPKENETYCNLATYDILNQIGYSDGLRKSGDRILLANEMAEVLASKYKLVDISYCLNNILNNIFVACKKDTPHGHIAIIYPIKTMVWSEKWKSLVPLCVNVGKVNAIMGLNWAFSEKPDIFKICELEYDDRV